MRNLTGERFGRLLVVCADTSVDKLGRPRWRCSCDCGQTTIVQQNNLCSGHTKSCGCFCREQTRKANTTHGLTTATNSHRYEWSSWHGMLRRCYEEHHREYHRYGDRGIVVCERWRESFANFVEDMGRRPKGLTLDRIDNNKGYSPDNCRWATWSEQRMNQKRMSSRG